MKEHSLFLEASFTEVDEEYKKIAREFQKTFSDILKRTVQLANGNVSRELLNSYEIVTKNTIDAENKTSRLTGAFIDTDITMMELNLRSGITNANQSLVNNISNINRRTLSAIQNLINFKTDILNKVLSCKMYTTNYPLLLDHIIDEAKVYYELLSKVERRENFTPNEIYKQELLWNNIMKEHAEFIRGLLDPTEKELIKTANKFAEAYEMISQRYGNNPINLTKVSLNETINFRDFKVRGEEGILSCKVKSIIIPLLADHVVREANHFIRILRSINI